MIEHSIRKNGHGEPVFTIRITGDTDIYRYAYHFVQGQVELIAVASAAFRYLRRKWGLANFKDVDQRLTGGRVVKWGYHQDRRADQ